MPTKNLTLIHDNRRRWVVYSLALIVLAILISTQSLSLNSDNGFDLTDSLVAREEIHHGGPARDGIPAIDRPRFVNARDASFLKADDRVLGLVYGGVVRAYPVKILNYHEIVNDTIGRQAIVISYCPLCGSGMAFKAELSDKDNTFGVSGLLYNSDMLLYDRATESLWSQIMGTAISGKLKGKRLLQLVLMDTTWANWLQQQPDSQVLSGHSGYIRDYDRHPYGDYDINNALYFPVSHTSARYHPKERVMGIVLGNKAKAYPVSELAKQRQKVIKDRFAGQALTIHYDSNSKSAVIYDARQQVLPTTRLFWFAWFAFHPETEVYTGVK